MDKNDAASRNSEDSYAEIQEQILILGVALGCALKATALDDPAKAKAIEDNIRQVVADLRPGNWQPLSRGLLDVLYSALQERKPDEQ